MEASRIRPVIEIARGEPTMTERLASAHQVASVEGWLKRRGFKANPFADTEADREQQLPAYFIETPYYDDILGDPRKPRSMVIYASRGCGKSAHRVMVSAACRPKSTSSSVLGVEYTAFESFSDGLQAGYRSNYLQDHVSAVLEHTVEAFLVALFTNVSLCERFPAENVAELRAYWRRHGSTYGNPAACFTVLRNLSQRGGGDAPVDWSSFRSAWDDHRLSSFLRASYVAHHPGVRLLADLMETTVEPTVLDRFAPNALFRRLVALVQSTGIETVYVLVDRVDESHALAANPDGIVDILVPLAGELPLMETPGAAFKLFLPTEVAKRLIMRPEVRSDRISFRELRWDEQTLQELLIARLSAFSGGEITSVGQLCEPDLAAEIDLALVKQSMGTPRNLLRLAEELITVHCQRAGGSLSLTREDWHAARDRYFGTASTRGFKASMHPPLRLDAKARAVAIGSKTIALTDANFRLLQFLAERKEKTVEAYELWQAGWSDTSLRTAVKRIRQAIEPDSKNPVYLITIRGEGLRLENVSPSTEQEVSQ